MDNPKYIIYRALALICICWPVFVSAQTPDTSPFAVPVKLDPTGDQVEPAVAVDSADRMLVVWLDKADSGQYIMVQGFDRLGGRLGPVDTASANPGLSLGAPAVAVDFDGTAVVAWSEEDGLQEKVYFRRYKMSGEPLESQPILSSDDWTIRESSPAVAVDSAGNLILVWQGRSGQDVDIYGTWFTYNDSLGEGHQDTLLHRWVGIDTVNASRKDNQTDPAVAADRKGNFVVVWRDLNQDSLGIRARVFAAGGIALDEFRIPWPDSLPMDSIFAPSITAAGIDLDSSHFLVSWIHSDNFASRYLVTAKVSITFGWEGSSVFPDTVFWIITDTRLLGGDKPIVSGNENGDVVLIWRQMSNCGYTIHSLGFNMEQGPGTTIASLTNERCEEPLPEIDHPAAAVRQNGDFAAVWEEHTSSGVDLLMQSFTAEGHPGAPLYIVPGFADKEVNRSAALVGHSDGGFTLFWERDMGENNTRIDSIHFDSDGKAIDEGHRLASGYPVQRRPVAARNRTGDYIIAWQERDMEGTYRIRAMYFGANEPQLSEPFTVGSVGKTSSRKYLSGVAVALGDNGQGYLVWERWNTLSSAPELLLARFNKAGELIGSLDLVAHSASGGGQLASVAAGSRGYHMVVWRQGAMDGVNAYVRGKVYDSNGGEEKADIHISEQRLGYLGSVGHPVVVASHVTGDFLVVWQEFFGETQRLYYCCYYYDSAGDSLAVRGSPRSSFDPGGKASSSQSTQTSPTVSVDSLGNYLILWVEKEPEGPTFLRGRKLDSLAVTVGGIFRVPGVEMAALPVLGILENDRFALAWQDTVGNRMRTLAQVLEIDFHTVFGQVVLSGTSELGLPVVAHIEGNVNDSVTVGSRGRFSFSTLVAGSYRLWFTCRDSRLPAELTGFKLKPGDPQSVDLGQVIVHSGESAREQLPRSNRFLLYQNVPNPFNPSTTISFDLGNEKILLPVTLNVYDLRGRLVAEIFSGSLKNGSYNFTWDGTDSRGRPVSSGIYLYRLKAGARVAVRKMVLIK